MIRRFRRWRLKRQMNALADVLRRIEATQRALGMNHKQRKQVWRDFVSGPRGREWVIQIMRGV